MGYWYLENHQPRKALDLCRRGVELAPNDSEAYYYLAMVYSAMGFYEAAVVTQEEAIRRDSFNLVLYNARVRFLVNMGHLEEATRVLDLERAIDPSSIVPWVGLAAIQLRRGSLDEYLKAYEHIEPMRTYAPGSAKKLTGVAHALASALKGDFGPGRRLVEDPEPLRHRQSDALLLPAVMGETQLTQLLLREHAELSNYRWVTTHPVMRR